MRSTKVKKRKRSLSRRRTSEEKMRPARLAALLRESELRFRGLIELSSEWYWEQDEEFRFTFFSGLLLEKTDYDVNSLLGMRRWEIPGLRLTEADWAAHRAQLERHEPFYDFEMPREASDGSCRWVAVSGTPIFDGAGHFKGYRGIGKDITANKYAEQALRESEARFRGLTEISSDWYWEQDEHFRFVHSHGKALNDAAMRGSHDIGKARWELDYIGVTEQQWAEHKALLAAHKTFHDLLLKRIDTNGVLRYLNISGFPIFHEDGKFKGYRGVGRDVTEQRQREEALLRFRAAVDSTADGIHIIDTDTLRVLDVNQSVCHFLGYTREEFLRLQIHEFAPHFDPVTMLPLYQRLFTGEDIEQRAEVFHRRKDGTDVPVEIHRRGVVIDGRRMVVNVVHDITKRKLAESVLRESEERFRSLTELSSDWYWQQDEHFRFVQVSGSVLQKTGLSEEQYVGKTLWDPYFGVVLSEQAWDAHRAILQAHEPFRDFSYQRVTPDGRSTYYTVSGQPYYDESGAFKGYRGVARDITEHMLAQQRIHYLATHDNLTGLPNRTMFTEMLNLAIGTAQRLQHGLALFFIDLDRFKNINDTFGHEAGDALLTEMSQRLQDTVRTSDLVARLGGDEFVILVQYAGEQNQITAVARKLLASLIKPFVLHDQECRVTASIGICLYPSDARDEQSLMKNADIAMYRAKDEGRNNFQFYSEQFNIHSLERLVLETSLRRAFERNEFLLHYQAKVNLRTGRIVGAEALLRWQHPEFSMISPTQFIPVAEEIGLIGSIGKWVLRTACAQNVAWQRDGMAPLRIAVNLSPRQFCDNDLLKDIAHTLRETGMSAELLELELTEGMVMQSPERAALLLGEIKRLGVRLSIDDFGVGYSSLAQIKRFPIDTIKIDRSFIRDIPHDAEDSAITETIIAMGKTLSLTVVAEGVEVIEQLNFLRERGCDQMQGYYFNEPIDAEQFAALVRRHTHRK